jgi:hypothetical protein
VETDVHFPTDINLLFDAIRKVITLIRLLCDGAGIAGWRQSKQNIRKIKKSYRSIQKLRRSTSKDEKKKSEREVQIVEAYLEYLDLVQSYLDKVEATLAILRVSDPDSLLSLLPIDRFMKHAERQIDQIIRRVKHGERIPHDEKVFSIFEEHTEWICKGKAGVPQELGLRVSILRDQYGFILHHQVMEKITDDKIAVFMVEHTLAKFPGLKSCSFDKGYYSPVNRTRLMELLETVILPKKGKLSVKDKEIEHSEEFRRGKCSHSDVESSINALENHGLDRCRDHGIWGFKRYVALAVLGRNIQILGTIIQQKELKRLKRLERRKKKAEEQMRRAAA